MQAGTDGRQFRRRWGWVGGHCGGGHYPRPRPGRLRMTADHTEAGATDWPRTSPSAAGCRSLADLAPGEEGQVVSLGCAKVLTRRLADLGFIPGASVRVVRRFAGGRLIEVSVRGWRLALRRVEARGVLVR